jgi:hypothetical protein
MPEDTKDTAESKRKKKGKESRVKG